MGARSRCAWLTCLWLGLAAPQALAEAPVSVDGSTPSGLPVPRWESLKADRVNGRAGPSLQHPVVWQYRQKGLPVQVVAETRTWRRVVDPFGDAVLIRADLLSPRQTVFSKGERAALRRAPEVDAPILAKVEPGVTFTVADCSGGWMRGEAPRAAGWMRADQLWGGGCAQ